MYELKRVCVSVLSALVVLSLSLGAPARADDASVARANLLQAARKITGESRTLPSEARYVGQNCTGEVVAANSPYWTSVLAAYQGLPVRDCSPTEPGLKARALVLLPNAEQITNWVTSACTSVGKTGAALSACGTFLLNHVNGQNGWQFIVSGVIWEPAKFGYGKAANATPACMAIADDDVLYSFRDGITATHVGRLRASWRLDEKHGCQALAQPSDTELEQYLTADIKSYASYGRLFGITRGLYAACTGAAVDGQAWPDIVRQGIITAWTSDTYAELDVVAEAKYRPHDDCVYG